MKKHKIVFFLWVLFFCFTICAMAHPGSEDENIRKVFDVLFESIAKQDFKIVESHIGRDFSNSDKNYLLNRIMKSEVDRMSFNNLHMIAYSDGSIAFPVYYYESVAFEPRKNVPMIFLVSLKKEKNSWKIASIKPFIAPKKRKIQNTRKINFSVVDKKTGNPVFSRVHISDIKGQYWPVDGHDKDICLGSYMYVGGDVRIRNKTYAYVEPEFTASLPKGKYEIEVIHGMEYIPQKQKIEVADIDLNIKIPLDRWVDMNRKGWYSGDNHVHFLGEESAFLEGQAEGLNIVNLLVTSWGVKYEKSGWRKLDTDKNKFTGKRSKYSGKETIVYVNQESRHRFLSHTILHPLKKLIYPISWGGPSRGGEGLPGGSDYPPMAYVADKAHAQGAIVSAAHFPFPPGEIAVDIALGKIDSIDLITFGDPFNRRTSTFHGLKMPTPLDLWYMFLNTGSELTATAGTDKMRNIQVIGSVRTYAQIDGELSYNKWAESIKNGKTFVTTGPMISITADNQGIGSRLERKKDDEIVLKAKLKSLIPVKEFLIIMGGKVIARRDNPDNLKELSLSIKTKVKESTWFAARAYSPFDQCYQRFSLLRTKGIPFLAHTSPIYVKVNNKKCTSGRDAEFLVSLCDLAIKWAENKAKFKKPEQKHEVEKLFKKAKKHYLMQVN